MADRPSVAGLTGRLTGMDDRSAAPAHPITIGGLHWMAWLFIAFALVDVAWFVVGASFATRPSPTDVLAYVLQVVPALAAVLLPAALLARHPDAPGRLPILLAGTMLLALVQGLFILAGPLQPLLVSIAPASEELPQLAPLASLYDVLTLLIAGVGILAIGLGLSRARWYEDRTGAWPAAIVPVTAIFATVVAVISVVGGSLGAGPVPEAYVVYLATDGLLGILRLIAWAYIAATALRGWRAGEDPVVGWGLLAAASVVIVLTLALINLGGIVPIDPSGLVDAYGWAVLFGYALGNLVLLAAFAFGLPAVDPVDEDRDG